MVGRGLFKGFFGSSRHKEYAGGETRKERKEMLKKEKSTRLNYWKSALESAVAQKKDPLAIEAAIADIARNGYAKKLKSAVASAREKQYVLWTEKINSAVTSAELEGIKRSILPIDNIKYYGILRSARTPGGLHAMSRVLRAGNNPYNARLLTLADGKQMLLWTDKIRSMNSISEEAEGRLVARRLIAEIQNSTNSFKSKMLDSITKGGKK